MKDIKSKVFKDRIFLPGGSAAMVLFSAADKIHHQLYHKLFIIGIALGHQQLAGITYLLICFELVGISE